LVVVVSPVTGNHQAQGHGERRDEKANRRGETTTQTVCVRSPWDRSVAQEKNKLKAQQQMYEQVRSDRNLFSKLQVQSEDEIAEVRCSRIIASASLCLPGCWRVSVVPLS
jgi:hypothetical protein